MSIMSQIAVMVLIILTGIIVIYASKGLENAALEGEKFVDEWALRQMRKEEQKKKYLRGPKQRYEEYPRDDQEAYGDPMGGEVDEEFYEVDEESFGEDSIQLAYTGNTMKKAMATRRKDLAHNERVKLIMLDEEKNQTKTIEIDHSPYTIGRDAKNDLSLNDLYVAKFHCHIVEENGNLLLKDLGTANKIFADGNMVDQLFLKEKEHFYIGGCEFVVDAGQHRSQPTILASKAERVSI